MTLLLDGSGLDREVSFGHVRNFPNEAGFQSFELSVGQFGKIRDPGLFESLAFFGSRDFLFCAIDFSKEMSFSFWGIHAIAFAVDTLVNCVINLARNDTGLIRDYPLVGFLCILLPFCIRFRVFFGEVFESFPHGSTAFGVEFVPFGAVLFEEIWFHRIIVWGYPRTIGRGFWGRDVASKWLQIGKRIRSFVRSSVLGSSFLVSSDPSSYTWL